MIRPDAAATAALAHDAVEYLDHGRSNPLLLVCEHASPAVPAAWRDLGLDTEQLHDHIGWDIGAGAVTRKLSDYLHATAILARYSRLFFDCNRAPGAADAIPSISDGIIIPGNRDITETQRALRKKIAFDTLHLRIATAIAEYVSVGNPPTLVCVHSFTRNMAGVYRPWDIGILWNECDDLAARVIRCLSRESFAGRPLVIGRNEPYSAKTFSTYTLEQHGRKNRLPNLVFEICNDLIRDEQAQDEMAIMLGRTLSALLSPQ